MSQTEVSDVSQKTVHHISYMWYECHIYDTNVTNAGGGGGGGGGMEYVSEDSWYIFDVYAYERYDVYDDQA